MAEGAAGQDVLSQRWYASDILDNGESWGVITHENQIVIGVGRKLAEALCRRIASDHNTALAARPAAGSAETKWLREQLTTHGHTCPECETYNWVPDPTSASGSDPVCGTCLIKSESAARIAEWRHLLWINHGCPLAALYGDDGEMQCGNCLVDFKRWSPDRITSMWRTKRERAVHAALKALAAEPTAAQGGGRGTDGK